MAILHTNKITQWDPFTRPVVGSIHTDLYGLDYKIFDGAEWISCTREYLEDVTPEELQEMLEGRAVMTGTWLESKYPDLKHMRIQYEQEYEALAEKYRIFEILKRSGE